MYNAPNIGCVIVAVKMREHRRTRAEGSIIVVVVYCPNVMSMIERNMPKRREE